MAQNTSVTLGNHFESFIESLIETGRYGSTSETIRAGLRLLEERETKIKILQSALIEGEQSEKADYSLNKLLNELGS